MHKERVVQTILLGKSFKPVQKKGEGIAPSNIALAKYWGKRDTILNLPMTSSLSVSLDNMGAKTYVTPIDAPLDSIYINGKMENKDSPFATRLASFLDLFRGEANLHFLVETTVNIPIGAGLASSACGFAALVLALNNLFAWGLDKSALSILARLGSGSAVRSFWHGFVEWQKGEAEDGMDSFGLPMDSTWDNLRIGLWIVNPKEKKISSREAMLKTVATSPFYPLWCKKQGADLLTLKKAIKTQDFFALGETAESNALCMHALMLSALPAIFYSEPETLKAQQTIWQAREQGLSLYFTQDAGPNLKLLFLAEDEKSVRSLFPELIVISPFMNIKEKASLVC